MYQRKVYVDRGNHYKRSRTYFNVFSLIAFVILHIRFIIGAFVRLFIFAFIFLLEGHDMWVVHKDERFIQFLHRGYFVVGVVFVLCVSCLGMRVVGFAHAFSGGGGLSVDDWRNCVRCKTGAHFSFLSRRRYV